MPARWMALVAALTVGVIAGLGAGWKLWRPKPAPPETYAREARQQDGSLVLERKPQPDAKPAHQVPQDGKVERVIQVVVQPRPATPIPTEGPATLSPSAPVLDLKPCPPVRVDLSLVRMPDLSRRVVASSPDGDVIGGVDIPVEDAKPTPKAPQWSVAGLVGYDSFRKTRVYGGIAQRSAGPFSLNAGVIGQTAFVGVGIRF